MDGFNFAHKVDHNSFPEKKKFYQPMYVCIMCVSGIFCIDGARIYYLRYNSHIYIVNIYGIHSQYIHCVGMIFCCGGILTKFSNGIILVTDAFDLCYLV